MKVHVVKGIITLIYSASNHSAYRIRKDGDTGPPRQTSFI